MINASLQREQSVELGETVGAVRCVVERPIQHELPPIRLIKDPRFDVGMRVGATIGERYECALWVDNLLDEKLTQIDSVLNLFNDASYQSFIRHRAPMA